MPLKGGPGWPVSGVLLGRVVPPGPVQERVEAKMMRFNLRGTCGDGSFGGTFHVALLGLPDTLVSAKLAAGKGLDASFPSLGVSFSGRSEPLFANSGRDFGTAGLEQGGLDRCGQPTPRAWKVRKGPAYP